MTVSSTARRESRCRSDKRPGVPFAVLTGLFGMNVAFPGEETHEAFWIVLGLLVTTLVSMVAFFRYKRWL